VNYRLIGLNLVYLAFVPFLPFPTGLVGHYEGNPLSLVLFAGCLAVVSTLEVVLLREAWRRDHLKRVLPAKVAH
jgi:uncharacterized membrane protein